MYRVGFPGWKIAARFGVDLLVKEVYGCGWMLLSACRGLEWGLLPCMKGYYRRSASV